MRREPSDEYAPGRHIQRNGKPGSSTNIFYKKKSCVTTSFKIIEPNKGKLNN